MLQSLPAAEGQTPSSTLTMSRLVKCYAQSMYSSGSSPRISVSGGMYDGQARGGRGGEMDITANKKATMQNLNFRLATYLDKVRALEKANAELELKICQFLEGKSSPLARDYSAYYATIAELQGKIQEAIRVNTGTYLYTDNVKLTADDFKLKFENELAIRMSVDSDITRLRGVLDEMTISRSDLEMQIEGRKEELIFMKKDQEELKATKTQKNAEVRVEVGPAVQSDLSVYLEEMRDHYEQLIDKNRKSLEIWFQQKSESLNKEMTVNVETVQTTKTELTDLKRMAQSLEIELQPQFSMKAGQESSLAETQSRYSGLLINYQLQISMLEEQLQQLKADIECQSQEYQVLLDMKTRLEMEIAEYRRLLEGEGEASFSTESISSSSSSTTRKHIIIIEQVVDGRMVTSSSSSSRQIM